MMVRPLGATGQADPVIIAVKNSLPGPASLECLRSLPDGRPGHCPPPPPPLAPALLSYALDMRRDSPGSGRQGFVPTPAPWTPSPHSPGPAGIRTASVRGASMGTGSAAISGTPSVLFTSL